MPEISRLGGTKILMFFHDENPPHIHVRGNDFSAKLRIASDDPLAGRAPDRVLRQVRRWMAEHRAVLDEHWREFRK